MNLVLGLGLAKFQLSDMCILSKIYCTLYIQARASCMCMCVCMCVFVCVCVCLCVCVFSHAHAVTRVNLPPGAL